MKPATFTLFVTLVGCGADAPKVCAPDAVESCTLATGQHGTTACSSAGTSWSECSVSQCTADASQVCENRQLFSTDSCGNASTSIKPFCICPCDADASGCGDYSDPLAPGNIMAPQCSDQRSCLQVTPTCAAFDGLFSAELTLTNTCNAAVTCTLTFYMAEPSAASPQNVCVPSTTFQPGQPWTSSPWSILTDEATCNKEIAAPLLQSWHCIAATDDASCLPADCSAATVQCGQ